MNNTTMVKKLSRVDTDFMRDYIQEGVDRSETDDQIKLRRKELVDLFGCSLAQVSGAVAWKKNGGDSLELKPLELQDGSIVNTEPVSTEVVNPIIVTEHVEESESTLDVPVIENIEITPLPETNVVTVSQQPEEKPVAPSEIPVQDIVIEIPTNPDTIKLPDNIRVHPNSGAWTDYEHSLVKEKWREIEMSFIDRHRHLLQKKPEEWKVLCTPGIKCYLEVKHLLERGVLPKNITAIERDKGAWGDFVVNCEKLGIQPVFGELKKVLPDIDTKFDLVLLDFLGQYCHSNQEVVYQVPVSSTAIVSINMGGKRERKDVQEVMQKSLDGDLSMKLVEEVLSKKYQAEGIRESGGARLLNGQQKSDRFFQFWREAHEEANAQLSEREIIVSDEHRDIQLLSLLNSLGMARPDSWIHPNVVSKMPSIVQPHHLEGLRKEEFNPNFIKSKNLFLALGLYERTVAPFRMAMQGQAQKASQPLRRNLEELSEGLAPIVDLAWKASIGSVRVHSMEKYRYLSRVGKTPSPYLTNIAVVQRPKEDYQEQRQTTQFALKFAEVLAGEHGKETKLQYPIGIQDERIYVKTMDARRKMQSVTSILIETALGDVRKYWEVENRYPLSDYDKAKMLPRVNIEG